MLCIVSALFGGSAADEEGRAGAVASLAAAGAGEAVAGADFAFPLAFAFVVESETDEEAVEGPAEEEPASP